MGVAATQDSTSEWRKLGAQDTSTVPRTVDYRGRSGIILAVNLQAIIATARNANGVIECVHRVGDFVATEDPTACEALQIAAQLSAAIS